MFVFYINISVLKLYLRLFITVENRYSNKSRARTLGRREGRTGECRLLIKSYHYLDTAQAYPYPLALTHYQVQSERTERKYC